MPTVSVLILNWNGKKFLRRCLLSLGKDLCPHVEIIVVDNGSTDGSVSFVSDNFPRVRVIVHRQNLGFSIGYNRAVPQAKGRYLVFLNNDTWVERGWLQALIQPLISDAEVGLSTANLLLAGTDLVDSAGGYLKLWSGGGPVWAGEKRTDEGSEERIEPFYACGAAMALGSHLFRQLGGFDDGMLAFGEDIDISWRARLLGYKVLYVGDATVHHHLSGSWGYFNPAKVRLSTRHQIRAMLKCLSFKHIIHAVPMYVVVSLAKGSALSVVTRNTNFLGAVLRAFRDILRNLGEISRLRRETQSSRKLPDKVALTSEGFGLLDTPSQLLVRLNIGGMQRLVGGRSPEITDKEGHP